MTRIPVAHRSQVALSLSTSDISARTKAVTRREFLRTSGVVAAAAAFPGLAAANEQLVNRLFPTSLPTKQWLQFHAAGFSQPVCGVLYGLKDAVTNGLAWGASTRAASILKPVGCLDM